MGHQKKKIGFLCLLLVVSGGWIAVASRQERPTAVPGTNERIGSTSFLRDPNLPSAPSVRGSQTRDIALGDPSLSNSELFLRMMLSVGLVVGLGAVALYLSKRTLPRVVHPGGKEIHILETAYLGPRKALHLVEVGGQRLLIASTSDRIAMLAGVPPTEFGVEEPLDRSEPELGEAKV
jgi:flagellar biogenesis protein FliO